MLTVDITDSKQLLALHSETLNFTWPQAGSRSRRRRRVHQSKPHNQCTCNEERTFKNGEILITRHCNHHSSKFIVGLKVIPGACYFADDIHHRYRT